jgi:capsular polysaccharide biosynthesis protein
VRLSASELDPSPSLLGSAWRFRLLVCVLVVVGAAAGFTLSMLRPVAYESTAQVLLPNSGGRDQAARQLANQIAVMYSRPALDRVAKLYGHDLTADRLRERVSFQASDAADLILVTATGGTPEDAARLADAVVHAYLATSTTINQIQDRSEADRIRNMEAELEAEVRTLRDEQARAPGDLLVQIQTNAVAAQLDILIRKRLDLETATLDPASNARAVGPAVLPTDPAGPGRMTIVVLTSVIGFVAAVVLSWWLAGLRHDGLPLRPLWAGRTGGLSVGRPPDELLPWAKSSTRADRWE